MENISNICFIFKVGGSPNTRGFCGLHSMPYNKPEQEVNWKSLLSSSTMQDNSLLQISGQCWLKVTNTLLIRWFIMVKICEEHVPIGLPISMNWWILSSKRAPWIYFGPSVWLICNGQTYINICHKLKTPPKLLKLCANEDRFCWTKTPILLLILTNCCKSISNTFCHLCWVFVTFGIIMNGRKEEAATYMDFFGYTMDQGPTKLIGRSWKGQMQ